MKTQILKTLPIAIAALAISTASSQAVTMTLGVSGDLVGNKGMATDASGIKLQSGAAIVPSAGTGVFDPFLQIQPTGGPGANETGFNSNIANGDVKQAKLDGTGHTRDLLIGDLAIVSYMAGNYYQISLDLNFSGGVGGTTDIMMFQLFAHNTANITSAQLGLLAPVISLTDIWTVTNINAGSGLGDVQFYIPTGLFGANTHLTLNTTMNPYDDGFEEFAAVQGKATVGVPDGGATVALFGLALSGLGLLGKFRRKN